MKITQQQSIRQDWDKTKSWNYKLKHLSPYQSIVYAEIKKDHGEVHTNDIERIYYIIDGIGEFVYNNETIPIKKGDVITVPPKTIYNYRGLRNSTLKVLLIMELWDN